MTIELRMPSAALAKIVLSDVSYGESLAGSKMHVNLGTGQVDLYSLEQVADFLHIESYDAMMEDTSAYAGYVNMGALKSWIDEVLGDVDLVEAINEATKGLGGFAYMVEPVKELLRQRIDQCRTAIADSENAPDAALRGRPAS